MRHDDIRPLTSSHTQRISFSGAVKDEASNDENGFDSDGEPLAKKRKFEPRKSYYVKKKRPENDGDSDWEEAKEPKVSVQEDDDIYEKPKTENKKKHKRRFKGNPHLLFPKYTSEMVLGEFYICM